MFDQIVPRYDLLNHLFSFGLDNRWRKRAVKMFSPSIDGGVILDICSGTGDLINSLQQKRNLTGKVIALDGSLQMLLKAKKKAERNGYQKKIEYILSNAVNPPLKEKSVNAAMVAFGVRNLSDPKAGLSSIYQLLDKNGELVILEFSVPDNVIFKNIYGFYFKSVMPFVGGIISGKKSAYTYLVKSVYSFNENFDICQNLLDIGFESIKRRKLTMGIVSLYYAKKP